jgi:undecaprenyl-diphosphatase
MKGSWSRLQAISLRAYQSRVGAPLFLLGGFVFSTLFLAISFRFAEDSFPTALTNLDLTVFRWFAGLRLEDGKSLFLPITRLGNTSTLVVVVSCVSLSFVVWRRYFEAALFGGGAALAALSMITTKWLIGRPRPASPTVPVLDGNPAFPSGHVAVGGVVYVLLAYLLTRKLRGRLSRVLLLGFGVVVALLLAWTRLYFAVHWMSDVLGGFALAGFWLAILTFLIISHRRLHPSRVSPPSSWQVVLQTVILIVLVIFLFTYIHP